MFILLRAMRRLSKRAFTVETLLSAKFANLNIYVSKIRSNAEGAASIESERVI